MTHNDNLETVTFEPHSSGSARHPLEPGNPLGSRYVVRNFLGRGSMGEVWLADEQDDDGAKVQDVVVKIVPIEMQAEDAVMAKIRQSFELVRRLRHSNICSALTVGTDKRYGVFLVMDYVPGESLAKYQATRDGGVFTVDETLEILTPLADALDFAHGQRILHRDIKPANIMVPFEARTTRQKEVQLIDFGLAAEMLASMSSLSRHVIRNTSGTLPYMPPEQINAEAQNARSDQYALAVTAYQMLTDRLPFTASASEVLIHQILNRPVPPLLGFPPHVNDAILRALAKDSKNRFASCGEFIEAMKNPAKMAVSPGEKKSGLWMWAIPGVLVFVFLACLVFLAWGLFSLSTEEPRKISQSDEPRKTEAAEIVEPAKPTEEPSPPVEKSPTEEPPPEKEKPIPPPSRKIEENDIPEIVVSPQLTPKPETVKTPPKKTVETPAVPVTPVPETPKPAPISAENMKDVEYVDDKTPGERLELTIREITYAFRWCPAGKFLMGSPAGEPGRKADEKPHEVTLTRGFWMLETQVTQEMWESVMDENPSYFTGEKLPVEQVSWRDSQAFIQKLNDSSAAPEGFRFSLPTEAQWEYACRAGTKTATYAGEMEILGGRNAPVLDEIAWYGGNSSVGYTGENGADTETWEEKQYPGGKAGTRDAGGKTPNAWGLHDMLGNVYEWCSDWMSPYSTGPVKDPAGPTTGSDRVFRGGSWDGRAENCRAANRSSDDPSIQYSDTGLRIIMVQEN